MSRMDKENGADHRRWTIMPSAPNTPFFTPKTKKMSPSKRKVVWNSTAKTKAVDLVTGKTTVEYFFDPSLVIQGTNGNDTPFKTPKADTSDDRSFFTSKHLFMPCTIIKPLEDDKNSGKLNGAPHPGPTLVKTSDGALHKISDSTKLVPLSAPADYVGMDDVLHMPTISEASLLHNLRMRYKRDDIYTSAGPILISVNPYKQVNTKDSESIYSEGEMMLYRSKLDFEDKPPHLFQIADRAYTALMDSVHESTQLEHLEDEDAVMMRDYHVPPGTVRDQSIIISGESGAGKTEATKIIMKFLARITRKHDKPSMIKSPDGKMIAALEDRVLSSNPLLETFGNAQTLRNDNSSRFGKFIHIYFNTSSGAITGASISNYLLEKTRVTHQVEGERNYHIFYQLLAGADKEMLQEFGLDSCISSFSYLGNHEAVEENPKDATDFMQTQLCLTQIGLGPEEQKSVFGMAAAVLHLGNIQFEERGDNEKGFDGHSENAKIAEASLPSLKKACELLGLQEDMLTEAILTKLLVVNGKTIKKSQNVAMAIDKRDALAKMTYSRLFLWLVNCVNETLNQTSKGTTTTPKKGKKKKKKSQAKSSISPTKQEDKVGFIGVLDIYGFECFEVNGYEQLLINYCNEKLQRHFNRHLFEVEQELYANEGVDWSYITFNDNRPCLELIEGGNVVGILNTLDDAWGGMGAAQEKDMKFVTHLHKLFGTVSGAEGGKKANEDPSDAGGHKNFVTPKFGNDRQFIILHYAGEVLYTADGFVEKNMETLSNELRELGDGSENTLSKKVYSFGNEGSSPSSSSTQRSSIRGVSVGSQFRTSLQSLVSDLERTQPHYIRCIKPNFDKAPNSFQSGEVLKQLRYSGMMEAIRIRREGYALREEHETFFNRFSVLLSSKDLEGDATGIVQLVEVLSKRLNVTEADWQIGHSKIFLRRELSDKLERLAKLRVHVAARIIGRFGRYVAHKRLSCLLVTWVRFRLRMLKMYREIRAANKLAAAIRRYKQQQVFISVRRAVVRVQSEQRRKLAVEQLRKLRDPYCDMSFKECRRLLQAEQARLEDAVKSKDFRLAAELEATIDSLAAAVEAKRPLTRAVLDARIEEAQAQLDDAVRRKAFSECAPLQDKLERLMNQRKELPTIDELREEVKSAEAAVARAAANRDFAAAAAGQTRIDEARQRLEDALVEESESEGGDEKENDLYGFESRAQLEVEITEITAQIKSAIDAKEFAKASSLQNTLEEREVLRQFFPSVEELKAELKAEKTKLDEAISTKNFGKAGKLNESIAELEKKLEAEQEKAVECSSPAVAGKTATIVLNGETKTFESRAELEKTITVLSEDVSKAVSSKEFKKADALQADLDRIGEIREVLPSISELEEQLEKKRQEMNQAICAKKFAKADEINLVVEELEKLLEKERHEMPRGLEVAGTANSASDVVSARTASVPKAISSGVSVKSNATAPSKQRASRHPSELLSPSNSKPVSKLRPMKPMSASTHDSILSVTKLLTRKRGSASVIVGEGGSLAGILTDTDITRRVVAKHVDAATTGVSQVMTPNPTCVSMTDSAMDALTTMVENHFRHLPVVDGEGSVVGLLDIAKCLNDAISKLEKSSENKGNATEDAVKQVVNQRGGSDAQAAALQALLGTLMTQAMGNQSTPTLRTLLAGKPSTVVSPNTSIRDAAMQMTESRKAALIVDNGELVGIFGFKDMMTRAVAKELPLDTTPVSAIMTPEPEAVSPDITVLEALQTMHDHRFLTLPVCEDDGRVVGLVGVMDVIYGCGGADGWRSMFSSAMDIEDDVSDVSSVTSGVARSKKPGQLDKTSLNPLTESADERPVSKLRPSKAIIAMSSDSIMNVSQVLAKKRGSASLIVRKEGTLAGILTDTDVTRRVVAKRVDPATTAVSKAMTPNPTCVSMTDSAMDALTTMVENHFRHLPVVDDKGSVVGLLDIAKCLNNAITRLERAQVKGSSAAEDAVRQAVSQQGASGAQAQALQALLGNLMSKAFGNQTTPTLRTVLAGKPGTIVSPDTSIREAGIRMTESRKATLVVEKGQLVGIFGFKDMMTRAVAKGLPLDTTPVSAVMTPEPETVSPDITVLEALQTMHDHRFLTLPVCEDDGQVVGLVDVMDVIYGCGGADGWRSMFSSAMELADDQSDSVSLTSKDRSMYSASSRLRRGGADKTVAKLRPSKPNIAISNEKILAVTQLLSRKRGSASLIIGTQGGLAGILTETDVTRRVVAKHVDPALTEVSEVMTPDPTCVTLADSAMDALATMVENHFRHLPVVDGEGSVVGLLDIAKCLNDAISKLENSEDKSPSAAQNAVMHAVNQQGASGAQAEALQALLGNLMAQAFGNQSTPTLRTLLAGKPSTVVSPNTSVRDTGIQMTDSRKAAMVVDNGELVGIFGFKDMMTRAVAKELPLDTTPVSAVMTPEPVAVSPDITVLGALQAMHDNRCLTLPVCEDDGCVVGLVDVMDVIYGCGGADGWRSIFSSAMDMDDVSAQYSMSNSRITARTRSKIPDIKVAPETQFVSSLPNNIPATLEFQGGIDDHNSFIGSTIGDERGASKLLMEDMSGSMLDNPMGVFKITDQSSNTHRIRCELKASDLLDTVSEKAGIPRSCLQVQFIDDEGDTVVITSDDDVAEAWSLARNSGNKVAKLNAVTVQAQTGPVNPKIMAAGAGVLVAFLGTVAFVLMKPKKA